MIQAMPDSPAAVLEERLTRGSDLLFDMEQRGDTGEEYDRYLRYFESLLEEYEAATSRPRPEERPLGYAPESSLPMISPAAVPMSPTSTI
jgi:hypothetical protein